jgi:hypothetical protein
MVAEADQAKHQPMTVWLAAEDGIQKVKMVETAVLEDKDFWTMPLVVLQTMTDQILVVSAVAVDHVTWLVLAAVDILVATVRLGLMHLTQAAAAAVEVL